MGQMTPDTKRGASIAPRDLPPYVVRRSERAHRVRLRVLLDGSVEVVVPKRARAPKAWLDAFVRENADWIRKQQARFVAQTSARERARYEVSGTVPFRGRAIPLSFRPSADGRLGLRWDGERFHVESPLNTTPDDVRALLERWFRLAARAVFEERLRALNTAGFAWTSLRIAEQKTRWGSCSRRGTLSFNWRLLMAPPEVLDYVVIHELSHLKEMNHSPRFWALVAERCPDYPAHVRWLKEHGASLAL